MQIFYVIEYFPLCILFYNNKREALTPLIENLVNLSFLFYLTDYVLDLLKAHALAVIIDAYWKWILALCPSCKWIGLAITLKLYLVTLNCYLLGVFILGIITTYILLWYSLSHYNVVVIILPIMSSPKSLNFRLFFKFLPHKTEQKMYDSHCILYWTAKRGCGL